MAAPAVCSSMIKPNISFHGKNEEDLFFFVFFFCDNVDINRLQHLSVESCERREVNTALIRHGVIKQNRVFSTKSN